MPGPQWYSECSADGAARSKIITCFPFLWEVWVRRKKRRESIYRTDSWEAPTIINCVRSIYLVLMLNFAAKLRLILISIICHRSDLAEKLSVIWVRSQLSGLIQSPDVISGGNCIQWLGWWDLQCVAADCKQVGGDEDLSFPQLCTTLHSGKFRGVSCVVRFWVNKGDLLNNILIWSLWTT